MKTVARLMCLTTAFLFVVLAIPFSLLAASAPQGEPYSSPINIVFSIGSLFALNALSLSYVGLLGDGISGLRRVIGGTLLLAPFGSGVALLRSGHKEFFVLSAWLLFVSVLAFWTTIWPASAPVSRNGKAQ
jgi:hypothetical protein